MLLCCLPSQVPIPEHIDIFFLENEAPASDYTGIQWIANEVKMAIAALEARAEALCEEYGPESLQLQVCKLKHHVPPHV